ncbi:MAG: phosphoglycerate mutase family protein [Candidatus Nanoarchaeia archaeon]|nr:phosphoglycerate mutase family protein [Candidatus Nanoarchaeia archaeon]
MNIDRIRQDLVGSEAIIYCFRHQESLINKLGYGDENSPLTEKGRDDAQQIKTLIDLIGIETIDGIVIGSIPRHVQTFDELSISNKIPITQDKNLDAIIGGDLFEEPDKSKIEERYGLSQFNADEHGLYHAHDLNLSFDPGRERIFPFGIYCSAIVDRRLRELLFRGNDPLTSFKEIEKNVKDFQANLKKQLDPKKQSILLCIGSCSSLAFISEFAKYGTIGENIINLLEGEPPYTQSQLEIYYKNKRLYPQSHDEFSVLYLNSQDAKFKFHLARQPVKDYLGGRDD